jgi:YVTN family beta-propeller protein
VILQDQDDQLSAALQRAGVDARTLMIMIEGSHGCRRHRTRRPRRPAAALIALVATVCAGLFASAEAAQAADAAVAYSLIATIGVAKGPSGILLDPITHTAYVGSVLSSSIAVIDTVGNTERSQIYAVEEPEQMTLDPVTHTIYAGSDTDAVSVFDEVSSTITAKIHVDAAGLYGLGVDPEPIPSTSPTTPITRSR